MSGTVLWVKSLVVPVALTFCMSSCSDPAEPVDCATSNLKLDVASIRYADCGIDNGEITVEVTGGSAPFTYVLDQNPQQSSNIFVDVKPGYRSITVKDGNGCVRSVNTFMGSKEPFPVNTSTTPSGCGGTNGSISVFPLGGIPPYKYQLGENNDNYQSSNTWENLRSGMHSIWVEDANTCFFGVYVYVPSGVSYATTVAPIIEAKCATAACHGGTQSPDFRTFTTIRANASKIKTVISNRSMPPDNSITGNEIDLIICWVDDGAPNN